ncbi:fused response regulator/phosphatase [bacterium]|nr:fused response regulator/phosphatase [bacterium]
MLTKRARPLVLVVDDLPENVLLLSTTLENDYQITVATSGQRALQLAAQNPPDLVLLDVMMPEMDGFQVCQALHQIPGCSEVPVIFVSALHETGDEALGLSLGAVDYITRPFQPALVKARVRNHLALKRQRDQLEQEVLERSQELAQALLARQLFESDLRLAQHLQLSMLPQSHWRIPGTHQGELFALLRPARVIGGDFYDYVDLGEGRLLFALGDVSGKGVTAALFMMRVFTLLRWLAPAASDPAHLLCNLNAALYEDNPASMFVCLACGLLDCATGEVLYSSGGEEGPVLLDPTRSPRLLDYPGGPALGIFPQVVYPLYRLQLQAGQTLLLASDGVAEASDASLEQFGLERLLQCLSQSGQTAPESVVQRCQKALDDFVGQAEPFDDLTLLALRPSAPEPVNSAD